MGYETPKKMPGEMSFQELEADEQAGPILQEVALQYLKEKDREFFDREFTGEIDQDGFLVAKKGGTENTKPSQNITGVMEWVTTRTKERLSETK